MSNFFHQFRKNNFLPSSSSNSNHPQEEDSNEEDDLLEGFGDRHNRRRHSYRNSYTSNDTNNHSFRNTTTLTNENDTSSKTTTTTTHHRFNRTMAAANQIRQSIMKRSSSKNEEEGCHSNEDSNSNHYNHNSSSSRVSFASSSNVGSQQISNSSITIMEQSTSVASVSSTGVCIGEEDLNWNELQQRVDMLSMANASKQDRLNHLERENERLQKLVDEQSKAMKKYGKIFDPATKRIQQNKQRLEDGLSAQSSRASFQDEAAKRVAALNSDLMNVGVSDDGKHRGNVYDSDEDSGDSQAPQYFATGVSSRYKQELHNNRFMKIMEHNNKRNMLHRMSSTESTLEILKQMNIGEGAARAVLQVARLLDEFNLRDVLKEVYQRQKKIEPTCVFGQFTLLTVPLQQMVGIDGAKGNNENCYKILDIGTRYLDPFVFESAIAEDTYPENALAFAPSDLSIFCFSTGIKSWLFPRSANKQVRRLFIETDKYQAITFTSEDGNSTHGIAVTTVEEENSSLRERTIPVLLKHRQRRILAKKIARWVEMKYFSKHKKSERRPSMAQQQIGKSFYVTNNSQGKEIKSKEKKSWDPYELQDKAREAYREMIKNDENDDILLVEKCYIFMDVKQRERILLCAGLKQMIDLERRESMVMGRTRAAPRRIRSKCPLVHLNTDLDDKRLRVMSRRHEILQFIRLHLTLSGDQKKIGFPKSDLDMATGKLSQEFDISLPIKFSKPIKYPLPLPQLDNEFGIALLLARFDTELLIKTLQLLLLEYSVLVIGNDTDEVTCAVEALVYLLRPYKWAGAFLPSMPYSMIEFVQSPVPFIAGITVAELQTVVKSDVVQSAYMEGMTLLNITGGKAALTSNREAVEMLIPQPRLLETLSCLAERLSRNWQSRNNTFSSFVNEGMSLHARVTLRSIRRTIEQFMTNLSATMNSTRDMYKTYGVENEGNFYFYPYKYIEPLKNETRFLQVLAHTQMFVSYVDAKREHHLHINELLEGKLSKILARWIWKKWCEYKKRKDLPTE